MHLNRWHWSWALAIIRAHIVLLRLLSRLLMFSIYKNKKMHIKMKNIQCFTIANIDYAVQCRFNPFHTTLNGIKFPTNVMGSIQAAHKKRITPHNTTIIDKHSLPSSDENCNSKQADGYIRHWFTIRGICFRHDYTCHLLSLSKILWQLCLSAVQKELNKEKL